MLQEADAVETRMAMDPQAGDETLSVRFRVEKVKDEAESVAKGRPVFKDREYITIRVPGDKLTINDRPVSALDRRRFHRQYEQFRSGAKYSESGTPLTEWPGVTRSQAEDFANFGIHSVEQLAATPDGNLAAIGPVAGLKQKAKAYLDAAKGFAPTEQLNAALAQRDSEIATLKAQMASLIEAQNAAAARALAQPAPEVVHVAKQKK